MSPWADGVLITYAVATAAMGVPVFLWSGFPVWQKLMCCVAWPVTLAMLVWSYLTFEED